MSTASTTAVQPWASNMSEPKRVCEPGGFQRGRKSPLVCLWVTFLHKQKSDTP